MALLFLIVCGVIAIIVVKVCSSGFFSVLPSPEDYEWIIQSNTQLNFIGDEKFL